MEEQGELQDTENVEKDRDATEDDGEHEAVNDDDAGVADVATQSAITVSENLINRRACIASVSRALCIHDRFTSHKHATCF